MPLLEVTDLKKYFPVKSERGLKAQVKAVDGVSFALDAGETLGLVGESGCGKSTTGRAILRLIEPTAGKVIFEGTDLLSLGHRQLRQYRRKMQIVFQDPYGSLNPRMRVSDIIGEPLSVHGIAKGAAKDKKVKELLEMVGLSWSFGNRYPHEFSGGQRQRIGIARALALNPKLLVCDEPVSALDVSIQSQILNLLVDLKKELNLTYLFISHAMNVIYHISDRVAIMYLGKIVELAPKDVLFRTPLHPYTQSLLSAIPEPDPRKSPQRILLQGDPPSPVDPPSGCVFHTRCRHAEQQCSEIAPEFMEYSSGHWVACYQIADAQKC